MGQKKSIYEEPLERLEPPGPTGSSRLEVQVNKVRKRFFHSTLETQEKAQQAVDRLADYENSLRSSSSLKPRILTTLIVA